MRHVCSKDNTLYAVIMRLLSAATWLFKITLDYSMPRILASRSCVVSTKQSKEGHWWPNKSKTFVNFLYQFCLVRWFYIAMNTYYLCFIPRFIGLVAKTQTRPTSVNRFLISCFVGFICNPWTRSANLQITVFLPLQFIWIG